MVLLSFIVGASLFVTTALADLAYASGYEQLKQAVKFTFAQMDSGLSNYTMESSFYMRAGDKTVYESTNVLKSDSVNKMSEEYSTTTRVDGEVYNSHSYRDEQISAWKSSSDDHYYVTEYGKINDWRHFSDPFQGEEIRDIERIIDALVGNLKDQVLVDMGMDGGKIYSGSLSEAQVPALVNAVVSFLAKQQISSYSYSRETMTRKLAEDVYVKRVSGQAAEDETGLLTNMSGELVLSGLDEQGEPMEMVFGFAFQIKEIGSTAVNKPDLTNAVVEKPHTMHRFNKKHIGTYRNNIVIEQSDQYLKIGERTIEITDVAGSSVKGRYYETIDPQYADLYPKAALDFTFTAEQVDWLTIFEYKNEEGELRHGEIDIYEPAKIFLNLNMRYEDGHIYYEGEDLRDINFDHQFVRVFE